MFMYTNVYYINSLISFYKNKQIFLNILELLVYLWSDSNLWVDKRCTLSTWPLHHFNIRINNFERTARLSSRIGAGIWLIWNLFNNYWVFPLRMGQMWFWGLSAYFKPLVLKYELVFQRISIFCTTICSDFILRDVFIIWGRITL